MPADRSTRAWLETLDDDELQVLLEARPDIRRGAALRDLDDLAARIEHSMSVTNVVLHLPQPAVEVLEVVTALGGGASTIRIIDLLDDGGRETEEHAHLALDWLDVLESLGLAWQFDEVYAVNPGIHRVLVDPLQMGAPARALVDGLTVDRLKTLYSGLGVAPPPRKGELLDGIEDLYADESRIRQAVARAPEQVATMLAAHAAEVGRASMAGVEVVDEDIEYWKPSYRERYQQVTAMRQWAVQNGLALGEGYYSYSYAPVLFPSEVMLALVPPSYVAPFHPLQPSVPTTEVSDVQIEHDSASAVTATVAAMLAVLESTVRTPVQELKSGGVGTRELNRVAKTVGVDVAEVRLGLELGALCEFFPRDRPISATGEFEQGAGSPLLSAPPTCCLPGGR
ncbi:hypothetical protein MWU75_11685 [Ornithinimicrobium sp. F0845]|uniref:hypothetical protein n=1 Tax=Ornithinimicrobium sp. F0845 TaxID=2926412 RepID=UPI001FF49DA1|nr:hypothetical protein [Ornithinimicrobium sp. F0845]MCK0112801.1 hypothetical protein [Ornithinimicrobium sp. F0845]